MEASIVTWDERTARSRMELNCSCLEKHSYTCQPAPANYFMTQMHMQVMQAIYAYWMHRCRVAAWLGRAVGLDMAKRIRVNTLATTALRERKNFLV